MGADWLVAATLPRRFAQLHDLTEWLELAWWGDATGVSAAPMPQLTWILVALSASQSSKLWSAGLSSRSRFRSRALVYSWSKSL